MVPLQERVLALISKPGDDRTDREIAAVRQWLRKKSEVLQALESDILTDVIRNCTYRKARLDDVIITQGEIGDCFYILLVGKTSVYIDTIKSDDDPPTEGNTEPAPACSENSHNCTKAYDDDDGQHDGKKKPLDRSQFGKFIMHFDEGKSFGEIALISEDSVRNASIIADEDSDLLVVSRDLFNRSMKARQEEEYEERKSFVKSYPLFSDWSPKFRRLLEMSIKKEIHPYGSVIVRQGGPIIGLLFILSGQAKVVIEPAKHTTQYPHLMKQNYRRTEPVFSNRQYQGIHAHSHHGKGLTSSQIEVRRKMGYTAAEQRIVSKFINLCCIGQEELIGDTEMILDLETNMSTVTSTGDTTVFILNTKNYDRLIKKKHPQTADTLKLGVLQKLTGRLSTTIGAHIPLLKNLHFAVNKSAPKPELMTKKSEPSKQNETGLTQLIEMFLQDRAPLIEPYLSDSLYYRKKSAQKTKQLMTKNKDAQRISNYDSCQKVKQKRPRSFDELRNNVMAERELLGNRNLTPPHEATEVFIQRPFTSVGFCTSSTMHVSKGRPKSAFVTIKECKTEYELELFGGCEVKQNDCLDHETVVGIFEEMEFHQKEKMEERLKIILSRTAKQDLQSKLKQTQSRIGCQDFSNLYAKEYFDWETSDDKLRNLEGRIKEFCKDITQSSVRDKHCVKEMKRFKVEDPQYVPLQGGAVFVHKKPCRYPACASVSPASHQHVRRFMLSRDPMSSLTQHSPQNSHIPSDRKRQPVHVEKPNR